MSRVLVPVVRRSLFWVVGENRNMAMDVLSALYRRLPRSCLARVSCCEPLALLAVRHACSSSARLLLRAL